METFDIFSVFTMLGGLAFFLYGMNVMSSSLEKLTGGRLESALRKITSSKLKSLPLGMGITIAIQSSSAVTVMLVGLVNSGIMQLEQTVAVCFGAVTGRDRLLCIRHVICRHFIKDRDQLGLVGKRDAAGIGLFLFFCHGSFPFPEGVLQTAFICGTWSS